MAHTAQNKSEYTSVIRRPRVTEKASMAAAQGVYAFEVSKESTKASIANAVRKLYSVTPVKVRIVAIPSKEVIVRGKRGTKGGGKKAYVYLKEGQTIEFV